MSKRQDIIIEAKRILAAEPDGLRWTELLDKIEAALPKEPRGSGNFRGAVWNLHLKYPEEIYKPSRGLFRLTRFRDASSSTQGGTEVPGSRRRDNIQEDSFYEQFAQYLVNQLEECTKAIALGGNSFGGKWGTPDVIGVYKLRDSDIVKIPLEVVSAEIKLDTAQLVTAFGQACAYRLFSHRSYLVVPDDSSKEDIDRLDSLCSIFGIGLIFFNSKQPDNPQFRIQVRAAKHTPDAYYVNEKIRLVADKLEL